MVYFNYRKTKEVYMKKCKIIHINDGTAKVITNGENHFVEEFPWAEELINSYLEQGYEVKQMVSNVTPNIQKEGSYTFFYWRVYAVSGKGGVILL